MYQEKVEPMLRPHQVENMKEEAKRLEVSLQAPPHIQQAIQDPGEMRRQLRNITHALETQAPKPYSDQEKDVALARERELREEILKGMPTTAEMRRNPVGAVDKHRKWEKRNKRNILEWKNIKLRMHSSDMTDDLYDAKDVANFERFRPTDASHELNMHGEQIAGKVQHGPYSLEPATVFTDEDKKMLASVDPEIAAGLALLDNKQRAAVKAFIQDHIKPAVQEVGYPDTADNKKNQKKTQSERMKEYWASKKAAEAKQEG